MKLAIMQPYFLPYIGYFQLIAAADVFILYDHIKYTKKGWINRNRLLQNGQEAIFSLPLKSDSDSLDICERELTTEFNRKKLLNQFREAYQRAPYFGLTFPVIERILGFESQNLFQFLHNSITACCTHLGISTKIEISSEIDMDQELKNEAKVLALCEAVGAKTYVNAIGGVTLYSKGTFLEKGVDLRFIQPRPFEYPQFGNPFVPWLSIVDVMMFNPVKAIQDCIGTNYELI